jgi:hypothetical protein
MMPSALEHVTNLVATALEQADDLQTPTSSLARKALRIARLRSDWVAVLWLQMELREPGDEEAKRRVADEVRPHFTEEDLHVVWRQTTEGYLAGRKFSDDRMLGQSLPEVEAVIRGLREQLSHMQPASGLHTVDLYFESQRLEEQSAQLLTAALEREQVVARVRQRIADYLSQTERQLVLGQLSSDVWERNRQFVDEQLVS